jgi:hypothetical protein
MTRRKRFFGKYRATVLNNADPQLRGRLQIVVPAVLGAAQAWAEAAVAMPLAGLSLPSINDAVWVEFEEGDAQRPLWTGRVVPVGQNVPAPVAGTLEFITPFGQKIAARPAQWLIDDGQGNQVRLTPAGVEVLSAAAVHVSATQVKVSAGMVQIDAGMSSFSGAVRCETLIATAVVASSYTPGAGNVL